MTFSPDPPSALSWSGDHHPRVVAREGRSEGLGSGPCLQSWWCGETRIHARNYVLDPCALQKADAGSGGGDGGDGGHSDG